MYTVGVAPLVKVYDLKHQFTATTLFYNFSLDICVVLCYTVTTVNDNNAIGAYYEEIQRRVADAARHAGED